MGYIAMKVTKSILSGLFLSFTLCFPLMAEPNHNLLYSVISSLTPSQAIECGAHVMVQPFFDPVVEGNSQGETDTSCCNSARINCVDELEAMIAAATINAECSGCTCPECGATSCTPYKKLPKTLFGGGNVEFGWCTSYRGGEERYKCRVECGAREGYWEGEGGLFEQPPKVEVGCTDCAQGHSSPNLGGQANVRLGSCN